MGRLIYGDTMTVEFDDRVLAHLQIVIGAKLRRGESFYFSWRDDARTGDGQTTLWIHPALQVAYKFYGGLRPDINQAWVEALIRTANSPGGLRLLPEPRGTSRSARP
jgi:hypothetical protein